MTSIPHGMQCRPQVQHPSEVAKLLVVWPTLSAQKRALPRNCLVNDMRCEVSKDRLYFRVGYTSESVRLQMLPGAPVAGLVSGRRRHGARCIEHLTPPPSICCPCGGTWAVTASSLCCSPLLWATCTGKAVLPLRLLRTAALVALGQSQGGRPQICFL